MTITRGCAAIAGIAVACCLVGAGIGYSLGRFLPETYRGLFASGRHPNFDPVAVGMGLGLVQGLLAGAVIGVLLVAIVAWYEVRKETIAFQRQMSLESGDSGTQD